MKNNGKFFIGETELNYSSKPYIIAEIGSNFDQDFEKACKLIEVAKISGANAVKFQLFNAEALYPNKDDLYEVFKNIELDPSWIPKLCQYASEIKIDFLASAFDSLSLEVLEKNNVIAHKIASSETTNLGFVNKVARTGKPLIISTGMCDFVDVEEALNICYASNNHNICIMQCGSIYPLENRDANLNVINSFLKRYDHLVGFSDHTIDNTAAITAVGIGARIFEKHITLNNKSAGPDHFYALDPLKFKSYVDSIKQSFSCLGSHNKNLHEDEKKVGRREGLYLTRDVKKGETIKSSDLLSKRPAVGIRARYKDSIVGAQVIKNLCQDYPLKFEDILM